MAMTPPPSSGYPPAISDRPLNVIYVMGAGRSGSTILGVALGNCQNVFYAGELEAWLRRAGIPNFTGAERAKFWSAVRRDVGGDDLFGDKAWRHLEYSLGLFRVHGWPGRRRLRPRYREITEALYRAIASTAQVTHIVDTSHYPLRAHEIHRLRGPNFYLIYLVRDPLSVAASFKRQDVTNPSKSFIATNAYLYLTHLLSVFVFLHHRADRRLLLRYEDFSAAPESMLRRILDWADASAPLPDLGALKTGIPFQGNRLLDSDVIALRPGSVPALPRSCGSHLTRLLQLPWTLVLSRLGPRATTSRSDY